MSNNRVGSQSRVDFHLLPKHRWNDEVARIVKSSKAAQQRLTDWSPELSRHRS
jgi:hypothetical protein